MDKMFWRLYAISLIIVTLISIIVISLVLIFITPIGEEWEEQRAECDKMEGCERFGCHAEVNSNTIGMKRNYLLKEQNCILNKMETRK